MKKALTVLTLVLLLSVFGFTQNLATVITALGARESTLTIFKQYAVIADLTVPANITLKFLQHGSITITGGETLTINGQVDAGLYQIFFGDGDVSFGSGSVREVYPEWWGIDGVADEVQINQVINSFVVGGNVKLLATTYLIAAPIVVTTKANLIGTGIDKTIIQQTEEVDLINIGIAAAEYITVKGMKLIGLNGKGIGVEVGANGEHILVDEVYCTTAEFGFVTFGKNTTFRDCEAYDNGNDTSNDGDGYIVDEGSENTFLIRCESSYHSRTVSNGFECEDWAINVTFKDCIAHHNLKAGFCPHTHNGDCLNVIIDGCYSYDNGDDGINPSGTDHISITNSFMYGNGENGVFSDAPFTMKNCHIYDNGDATTGWGIWLDPASDNVIIEGCKISHNAFVGAGTTSGAIYASGVRYVSIKNNVIEGCYGINLFNQLENMHVVIEGNRLIGNQDNGMGNGIYINNSNAGLAKSLRIHNNFISGFGANGIRLAEGKNIIISGNIIKDNTTYSINCAGAATINVQIINNNMQAGNALGASVRHLNTVDDVLVDVPGALTIAGDGITVTRDYHILTPQAGAADDLSTINGGFDGMLLTLKGDGTFQIDVKHNVGNILLTAGDYLLPTTTERILLQYDATLVKWIQLAAH